MKKLLTEYYQFQLTPEQLTEATSAPSGAPLILKKVLVQRADSKNRNGRKYPKAILEREISAYNDNFVKARRALGELDHCNENVVNLKNVSHLFTEMWWEGDDVYANIEVLNGPEFPAGRIMEGLIKRRIPVGFSTRGMGSVTELDENTVEVNDDFSLLCIDAVSYESTQGANYILQEGYQNNAENKYSKLDSIIHDIICNNSGVCSCMFDKK